MGLKKHLTFAVVLLCTAWLAAGCSGRSLGARGGEGDGCCGYDPDGGPVVFPDGTVPTVFCQGENKLELNEVLISPAAVTSSQVVMDCCGGAFLHFHVTPELGYDPLVMIRTWGGWVYGEYDLEDPDAPLEVSVFPAGGEPEISAQVTGTVNLDPQGGEWDDPVLVTLCGEVEEPGAFNGLRVWVDRFMVASYGWANRWSIWLVADPALSAVEAASLPLESLDLEPEPVIHLSAIPYYRWSSHTAPWEVWYGPGHLRNAVGQVGVQGVPFVVQADGERIYLGAFFTSLSSYSFDGPVIMMDNLPDTHFTIERSYPGGSDPNGPDLRADPRIKQVLSETGKLAP